MAGQSAMSLHDAWWCSRVQNPFLPWLVCLLSMLQILCQWLYFLLYTWPGEYRTWSRSELFKYGQNCLRSRVLRGRCFYSFGKNLVCSGAKQWVRELEINYEEENSAVISPFRPEGWRQKQSARRNIVSVIARQPNFSFVTKTFFLWTLIYSYFVPTISWLLLRHSVAKRVSVTGLILVLAVACGGSVTQVWCCFTSHAAAEVKIQGTDRYTIPCLGTRRACSVFVCYVLLFVELCWCSLSQAVRHWHYL
jgi:hypothetical protein